MQKNQYFDVICGWDALRVRLPSLPRHTMICGLWSVKNLQLEMIHTVLTLHTVQCTCSVQAEHKYHGHDKLNIDKTARRYDCRLAVHMYKTV